MRFLTKFPQLLEEGRVKDRLKQVRKMREREILLEKLTKVEGVQDNLRRVAVDGTTAGAGENEAEWSQVVLLVLPLL